jgi:hypothetical protein
MVDQTERRRQHELVVRENIVSQHVVMMFGRDVAEEFECRTHCYSCHHFTKLFVAFAAFWIKTTRNAMAG